jgi:hypothetical protein
MREKMDGATMNARYDHLKLIIAERLATSATERLASEAHQTKVEQYRMLSEIRARFAGALAGAGSALTDQGGTDEGRVRLADWRSPPAPTRSATAPRRAAK